MTPPSRIRFLTLAFLASICGACAGVHSGVQTRSSQTLEVDNGDFYDVLVSVERDGTRIALGIVAGLSRRTFRLSSAIMGGAHEVRLVASSREPGVWPLAVGVPVQAGDLLDWTLLAGLRHQTLVIR